MISQVDVSFQMVTSVSMQTLHGMFAMRPNAKSLPADLNARIITVSDSVVCLLLGSNTSWK